MEQNIYYVNLIFYKVPYGEISDSDIESLKRNLNEQFSNNKFECVHNEELYNDIENEECWYAVTICHPEKDEPLCFNDNLSIEKAYPPSMYDPGSCGGVNGVYESIKEFMKDKFTCPENWTYDIDDYEMDTEEQILDRAHFESQYY